MKRMNIHKTQFIMMPSKTGLLFLVVMILAIACTRQTIKTVYPTLSDGRYDSEFPYKACSEQLAGIARTVKKLNCYTEYEVFIFSENAKMTSAKLKTQNPAILAIQVNKTHEAQAGTATLIQYNENQAVLLTCQHILDYPDTIISFFDLIAPGSERYIYSLSVKKSQHNIVRDFSVQTDFGIIAKDSESDIALIGAKITKMDPEMKTMAYPLGQSKNLEWGSFVYAIGYPLGQQMITKGIVSSPDFDGKGSFIIDAVFNTGFSGGLILAIKDGVPNFEIVGLGRSASANYEYYLKPAKERHEIVYNPNLPYEDDIYVSLKKEVNYGITHIISTEKLMMFYKEHKQSIINQGYDLSEFFKE